MSLFEFLAKGSFERPIKEILINGQKALYKTWENSGCHEEHLLEIDNKEVNMFETIIRQVFEYDKEDGIGFDISVDKIIWSNWENLFTFLKK